MIELVFATANSNKLTEVNHITPSHIRVLDLNDIGCHEEIPETQPTIEGNASQKAGYVNQKYHCNCFAEDTGLEVDALNGAPGVWTARYAGVQASALDNMELLLKNLHLKKNRNAQFKSVISLIINDKEILFEGIVKGTVVPYPLGSNGFGYDPVFKPQGYEQTFGEMDSELKNRISHRYLVFHKMVKYLEQLRM